MADDKLHLRMDGFDDAFNEWDENAPTAQLARGSLPNARPVSSRAPTLSDPVTTRRLAKASQQIAIPQRMPETLEEALLALAEKLSATGR
jgi:hypothetical protein